MLAADHIIRDTAKFHKTCCEASAVAAKNIFVTFGVHPKSPATSYGYIKPGMKFDGLSAFKVYAFVKTPDFETATIYFQKVICGIAATSFLARTFCSPRSN